MIIQCIMQIKTGYHSRQSLLALKTNFIAVEAIACTREKVEPDVPKKVIIQA